MIGMFPITVSYDYRLVALSILIAIVAFYLALNRAGRVTASRGSERHGMQMENALAMCSPARNSPAKAVPVSFAPECMIGCLERMQGLPASEDIFHGIFDSAPLGMCAIGLDSRFLAVNRALCAMLGYSAEEMLATSLTKLTHPDDQQSALQQMAQSIKLPGEWMEAENRLVHRSGTAVLTCMRVSLARDGTGSPLYFVVQAEDITERKRAAESLRDSDGRFRIMADSCPSMMWAINADEEILFLNKAARAFCGKNSSELNAGCWQLMIHPDDAPRHDAALGRAIRERAPFSAEARVRRVDREWRLLGSRAEPSFAPSGEYLGHFGLSADITERVQTEQTRQFDLSLIRSIQETSLDGILVVNGAGLVVSHNTRFLDIWGMSSSNSSDRTSDLAAAVPDSTMLSKVIEQVRYPEAFMRRVRELYEDPDADDHSEIRLKDGRTLERHSTSLRSKKGEYLGRVWFFRDITARKQAEISLQEAKASSERANRRLMAERSVLENERKILRALIDNIPDFMYVKDAESRFLVANAHLARVVGAETPEELVGKTDFDFFPKNLADTFYEDDQGVMWSGQPLHNREEKTVDSEGNERHVLTTKVPLRDHTGQVVGIAGVGRDISERKTMEDALREAERKYREIFDGAIVGIFQSTPGGRFVSVNSAMASALGHDSPEEMIASTTDIARQFYVDPKRRAELISILDKLGSVKNFESQVYRKDGSRIWLSMSIRAIRQKGVLVRYEGMCEDITERNLLREQLLQAQKLESVGQLAAGIAHEINTPTQYIGDNVRFLKDAFQDLTILLTNYEGLLSAVKGDTLSGAAIQEIEAAVKFVGAGYLLEEIPKAIDQTLEGVTRVSKLVSAMKEFSHPGTKDKTPVDLNHAIDSTITVARNEWKYVADLVTDFDKSLPLVPCQPGEFNQVILNLIVNSAHAIADVHLQGGPKKGTITVQTLNCCPWAEVRIQDTGSGIPEKIRTRIFDPFFTTKEIGKGTGQGLAIARSVVVDKHGGSIRFETEEGKGTTFIIRLPFEGTDLAAKAVSV